MTDHRDTYARTRDAVAALVLADSALAEAAGLVGETFAARLLEALREVLAVVDSEISTRRCAAFEALQNEQKNAVAATLKPLCEHCPGSTLLIDADSQSCENCGHETFSPVAKLLMDALEKVDMPGNFCWILLRDNGFDGHVVESLHSGGSGYRVVSYANQPSQINNAEDAAEIVGLVLCAAETKND